MPRRRLFQNSTTCKQAPTRLISRRFAARFRLPGVALSGDQRVCRENDAILRQAAMRGVRERRMRAGLNRMPTSGVHPKSEILGY